MVCDVITLYIDPASGDIDTLESWREESVSGLRALDLTLDGERYPTGRRFEGEEHLSEWVCGAEGSDGERYKIAWIFPAAKGSEPGVGDWPWDDVTHIAQVATTKYG